MLKFANELILVLDNDFKVAETNENFLNFFRLKKEDVMGSPINSCPVNNLGRVTIEDIARDAFDSGERTVQTVYDRDGQMYYLSIKAIPSVFDDATKGSTLIFEDITEKKQIEDRLRISEAKFRAIVEDQTELVGRFDKDLRILFANHAALQFYGVQSIEGAVFLDFVHPADRERVLNSIKGLSRERPVDTIENRSCFGDGTSRWLQWTNRAVFNNEGEIIEYQGVGRDITEKKRAEEALIVKDLAIGASINGIAIANLDGLITYANQAYIRMFGYESENDVIHQPIDVFSHGDPIESGVIRTILADLRKSGSWSGEVAPRRRDGTQISAFLTASVVKDPSGVPFCMMASFADITDIKRAREEIQLKNTAIASSINAIAIFDSNDRLIYVNDSFLREFGYAFDEIRGKSPKEIASDFEMISPSYMELESSLSREGGWKGEVAFRKKGGALQYLEASFRKTPDSSGGHLYVLASFVNITDHKEAETALRSSRQKLQETIEFMADPTFIIDRNHRVIAWNRAIETLTGVKREEVLGRKEFTEAFAIFNGMRPVLVDLLDLPPHELARNYPSVRRFGDSIYVEAYISEMNGGKGAFLWGKASALIDHEGHPIGAIESIRDISAWKHARESLKKAEASEGSERFPFLVNGDTSPGMQRKEKEMKQVLDLVDEAVVLMDRSGKISWANQGFVQLVGGEREIVLGAQVSMFFPGGVQQILDAAEPDAHPGGSPLMVSLMPLTRNEVMPVEVKMAGRLPEGDSSVLIIERLIRPLKPQ